MKTVYEMGNSVQSVQSMILRLLAVASLLAAFVPAAQAQALRHPVSGRAIAGVMGVAGAPWLERSEREAEERPSLAVKLLKIQPGMSVADIGAGSGYYTELLVKAVGAQGKVFATDIQPGMVKMLRLRAESARWTNIEVVQNTDRASGLPASSIDLALMVDVYHELSFPQQMLKSLMEALRPGGQLVLLEFRAEDPQVPIRPEHKMSVKDARKELEHEGFVFDKLLSDLPWQHLLIFRKPL